MATLVPLPACLDGSGERCLPLTHAPPGCLPLQAACASAIARGYDLVAVQPQNERLFQLVGAAGWGAGWVVCIWPGADTEMGGTPSGVKGRQRQAAP